MVYGLKKRLIRFISLSFIAVFLFAIGVGALDWFGEVGSHRMLFFIAFLFGSVAFWIFVPARTARPSLWLPILFVVVFLLSVPFILLGFTFGSTDVESVLILLQDNTLTEIINFGTADLASSAVGSLLLVLFFLFVTVRVYYEVRFFGVVLLLLAGIAIFNHPVLVYTQHVFFPSADHLRIYSERGEYNLDITERPQAKKNLVLIYLEGFEQNYLKAPETRSYTGPLQEALKNSIRFTNVGQVRGTHFSVAGLTATQCGVPLMPSVAFDVRKGHANMDQGVYPQIVCLADILAGEGYDTSYFVGTGYDDFSLGKLLETHSFSELFGPENATFEERDQMSIWGLQDRFVFQKARDKLTAMAQTDRPFLIAIETISTHGPDGLPDNGCHVETDLQSGMPASLYCISEYTKNYLELISELGLADDTIVAVMSDHLAWKTVLTPALKRIAPRRNLFALFNAGEPAKIDKLGVAFDIFPTILEALGYGLKNDRANMGVSLFSDKPSMASQYGLEQLNDGLIGNRELADWLWRKVP
ncbi:LTA synthase family protein [Profundibacter sp.]